MAACRARRGCGRWGCGWFRCGSGGSDEVAERRFELLDAVGRARSALPLPAAEEEAAAPGLGALLELGAGGQQVREMLRYHRV